MSHDRRIFAALIATVVALWAMTAALYLAGCPAVRPGNIMSALEAYRHEEALSRAIVASTLATVLVPLMWIIVARSDD